MENKQVPWDDVGSYLIKNLSVLIFGGLFAAGVSLGLSFLAMLIFGVASSPFNICASLSVWYLFVSYQIPGKELTVVRESLCYLVGAFLLALVSL